MPASSRIALPSDLVTTMVGPMGRQPWLTNARTVSGPSSTTPTAPRSATRSSSSNRVEPGPSLPEAMPPIIGTVASSSLACSTKPSTGKEYGSASRIVATASGCGSGRPTTAMPSGLRMTSRWKARMRTPGSEATQTLTACPASTPSPSPITPETLQPSRVAPGQSMRTRSAMAPVSSGWSLPTNTHTRSGLAPESWSTAWSTARSAARTTSASRARPSPNRATVTPSALPRDHDCPRFAARVTPDRAG